MQACVIQYLQLMMVFKCSLTDATEMRPILSVDQEVCFKCTGCFKFFPTNTALIHRDAGSLRWAHRCQTLNILCFRTDRGWWGGCGSLSAFCIKSERCQFWFGHLEEHKTRRALRLNVLFVLLESDMVSGHSSDRSCRSDGGGMMLVAFLDTFLDDESRDRLGSEGTSVSINSSVESLRREMQ